LHVFYQNVRGLRTKLIYFRNSVLTLDCDLLFLSETWLNINYSDDELGLVNYNIFRADREYSHEVRGGGVLLAINIKYNCIRIPTEIIVGIDFIFTLLNYNNCKLLLSCVYIPQNTHNYSYTAYCQLVERIISSHCITNILIIGDFNIGTRVYVVNQ